MAFTATSFQPMHQGGSYSKWLYHTDDATAVVETDGYFDDAVTAGFTIRKGDVIEVCYDMDGTPGHSHFLVSALSASDVTLTQTDVA